MYFIYRENVKYIDFCRLFLGKFIITYSVLHCI